MPEEVSEGMSPGVLLPRFEDGTNHAKFNTIERSRGYQLKYHQAHDRQ